MNKPNTGYMPFSEKKLRHLYPEVAQLSLYVTSIYLWKRGMPCSFAARQELQAHEADVAPAK
ncbi:hypothetical protein AC781_00365 [Akkermansia glycaniphila]|nr:hypothetical protein AC781_10905 [Akkermansia glycaniphila]OCA04181.1 hypothetical protein AC781_00365 [Akkermansia glycaniphila]